MRFHYSPQTGQLTVYATSDEFQLAAGEKEYRVVVKDLKNKDGTIDENLIFHFIEEFSNFTKKIFQDIYPQEKIQDIVVMSTKPKFGFTWTSLLNYKKQGSSLNFISMIIDYLLNAIKDSSVKKSNKEAKELDEIFSKKDLNKLEILNIMINSMTCPSIWKMSRKKEDATRLNQLNIKITKIEKKYGYSSEEMYKYYSEYKSDESLETPMQEWLKLYEERRDLLILEEKNKLINDFLEKWSKI